MEAEPKFSFAEGLLMLLITLFADGIEAIVVTLGVVPFFTPVALGISWAINFFVFGVIQLWFIMKGERGLWFLSGSILEFVPFINILPLRSTTCALSIYLANHPKIAAVAKLSSEKLVSGKKIKRPAPLPSRDTLNTKT